MNNKLYLGTRKGLLEAVRGPDGWEVPRLSFIGVQVPMLLPDARDRTIYAAVEHGHFGSKIHASADGGTTWKERACPIYPPKPDDYQEVLNPMSQEPGPWT